MIRVWDFSPLIIFTIVVMLQIYGNFHFFCCRFMSTCICKKKKRYFFIFNYNPRLLWPNCINFLHNLGGDKDTVCFDLWRSPLVWFQSNGTLFMNKIVFFHILYYNCSDQISWNFYAMLRFITVSSIFNLTILCLLFQSYKLCLLNWTLFRFYNY